ncbi:GGDEF domain-containing protein [Wukongibacter baidiensis]|uniref:diguanylate cyclase domain-containing protein n=1 Tax=Wukongibacter baidiensis TaxID=1723361 RepID=UPI003D7FE347
MEKKDKTLKSQMDLEKQKVLRVDSLNNLSEELEKNKPKRSFELSKEAYTLAKEINYEFGILRSLFRMGRGCWLIGDFQGGITYLFDSIDVAKKVGDQEYEVDGLNVLGNIYLDLQNFDISLKYYMKALKLAGEISYGRLEGRLLNNIGEIYKYLKEYEMALEYYRKSIYVFESLGYGNEAGVPKFNIGQVYYHLRKYELAKEYNECSLKIFRDFDDRIGESYSLHQLARVYQETGQNDLALEYYYKSLGIFAQTEDRFHEIEVLIDLYKALIEKEDCEKAIQCLRRGLELAKEVKANSMIAKICSYLAVLYEEMEEYEKAIYFYKKFHDTEKEEKYEKLAQKINSVKAQFEMEQSQQEKEIYRLKNIELRQKTHELEMKTIELEESYRNVTIISKIGQNITSTLNLEEILNTVYVNVNELMDACVFGIGLFDEEKSVINYEFFIDESDRIPSWTKTLDDPKSLAVWCVVNKKEIMISDVDEEYTTYVKGVGRRGIGSRMKSIIYYPLMVENTVVGMVTVQSKRKEAYTKYNLDMIKALASYIAIAINNAKKSQKLSKEIQERRQTQRQLEKANCKLMNISKLDGLTNIPNRREFDEHLEMEWHHLRREENYLSLLIIDIDYFKEFNDNYGHLAGDRCIIHVAKTLQSATKRTTDFVARYGGDEFVAILPYTDEMGAEQLAEEMRAEIAKLDVEHKFSCVSKRITITIGISTIIPSDTATMEDLINMADKALYIAKNNGRNRVHTITEKVSS